MPVNVDKLIEAVAVVCTDRNLKATVWGCLQGGLVTGAFAVLGGLLSGPLGLAIGGALGGVVSGIRANKKFEPVHVILRNMPDSQKKLLYDKLKLAFAKVGIVDVIMLSQLLMTQVPLQEIAIKGVNSFLKEQMNLRIAN